MRCLLLAIVAGLAVLTVRIHAEDSTVDEDVVEVVEIDLENARLGRMLGDLFDDQDFEEALEEQESNREARARGSKAVESPAEEEKAVVDAKDQARYNSFVDTFFRRLNSFARSQFDPLSVGLESKSKKGKSGKGKPKAKKQKKRGKKGKKSGKKSDKKGGKEEKKSRRHPKDLDLDEVAAENHEEPIVDEEEVEVHDINKRETEAIDVVETDLEEEEDDEQESLVRVTRNAESPPMKATSRRAESTKGSKKSVTKNGKNEKEQKKKRKGKNGKKSKKSAKASKPRTSRASVTGIATVRRSGDVKVSNKKGGKEMRAAFTLGPVDLKVNRKFGKGKNGITKEARAVSPELTGKLSIHVAKNGQARLTNFRINRPAIVQVEGSLRKTDKGGKTDNNFMERSIGRFSPIASKKLKAASRKILSAVEPKVKADE